ncbi:unnamed protein product [Allacma fusca]|uniref:Uncharacterized protein n=1 Tax=Allacma fusca TaxID=39272 RepID=A0A8J2KQY7_9HEXA|nr:unnamed protein product [Allacma fusca]
MSARQRRYSVGGYSTSSPIFYSIPWNPTDYSVSGLGPGSSSLVNDPLTCTGLDNNHLDNCNGRLDYSKSGFTYFNNSKCICGFLSEYRKQYNRRAATSARPYQKPWWNGREMTSKFDPRYPCYPMHIEHLSTYTKDYQGERGQAADLCYPEGEIERASKVVLKRWDHRHRGLDHAPIFASAFNLNCY